MSSATAHIVYLVHGATKFHEQVRFSILTFLHCAATPHEHDARILVFTDRPELLPVHPAIQPIRISAQDVRAWRGPLDFVHRPKLEAMRRAAAQFGAPLVYVDSDTRWTAYPDAELAALQDRTPGDSGKPPIYLHENEGPLSPQLHPRYHAALAHHRTVGRILSRHGISVTPPWTSWNAGTIGIPRGAEGFFDEALALTDALTLYLRPRTYVEQLAVSLVAARDYSVLTLERCIHHYWYLSAEFTRVLPAMLSELADRPLDEQARAAAAYAWDDAVFGRVKHAPAHRWKTRYAKWWNSLHKRRMDLKALWLRSRRGN